MANLTLTLDPAQTFLVAAESRVRESTEYGTDTRQKRAGANLVQFSALVISGGNALGVIQVTTSGTLTT